NNVHLRAPKGEMLGIIGESGSGKSTLLRILYGLESATSGRILFHDGGETVDLLALDAAQRRRLRDRKMGMVYQNPHLGLNFHISAGGNIAERILVGGRRHYGHIRARATELLNRTDVPVQRMDETPAKFSGGMQQRVQIAKALATDPTVLFLDEVTTSLDLSVQAKILDLILELHRRLHLSVLLVTHDIGVVRMLAGHTVVMRYGQIVETGLTDQILEDPQHAYTQELIGAAL
ncbi:MAG TPA: ATP-binding cassette domain-containing protein, partial [Chthonomonadaceae bacterium]|nr:ATP-binding cassette domain-containing protein [Chthonomonadaceae bacterium]